MKTKQQTLKWTGIEIMASTESTAPPGQSLHNLIDRFVRKGSMNAEEAAELREKTELWIETGLGFGCISE